MGLSRGAAKVRLVLYTFPNNDLPPAGNLRGGWLLNVGNGIIVGTEYIFKNVCIVDSEVRATSGESRMLQEDRQLSNVSNEK